MDEEMVDREFEVLFNTFFTCLTGSIVVLIGLFFERTLYAPTLERLEFARNVGLVIGAYGIGTMMRGLKGLWR